MADTPNGYFTYIDGPLGGVDANGNSLIKKLQAFQTEADSVVNTITGGAPVALADPGGNGIVVRTSLGVTVNRTLTQPAAGFTITDPSGVAGNPTFVLANDLAALEALTGTGFASRTGVDAWALRTPAQVLSDIGAQAAGSYQPLDADLTAIAALAGTSGLLKKTAADTWSLDTSTYATQAYADALVLGLLDDRGNYDASGNVFPSSGGSGAAGAVLKGDLWTIGPTSAANGTLGIDPVTKGDVVRALVDTPGQTAANWAIGENNFGYVALNQSLADGKIYVGNGSGIGTAVTPAGDVTISNAGVTAIGAGKVLSTMIGAMTSAQLAGIVSDETGDGQLVFATAPQLTAPNIGVAFGTSLSLTSHVNIFSGGILQWDNGAVTVTHSANALAFAGGSSGYSFDAQVSAPSLLVDSARAEYIDLEMQVSAPSSPTGAIRLYADLSSRLIWDNAAGISTTLNPVGLTADRTFTFPDASGTLALTADKLSAFASTTSAELKTVISDETGSGALVFATSPTLVTPNIGVATGTSLETSSFVNAGGSTASSGGSALPTNYSARVNRYATGADTADTHGLYVRAQSDATGTTTLVRGALIIAERLGANTATELVGAQILAFSTDITTITGSVWGAIIQGASHGVNTSHTTGVRVAGVLNHSGATSPLVRGVEVLMSLLSGSTATEVRGISVGGWTTAGATITTSYGIYMDTSIDVGATKWALYSTSLSNSLLQGGLNIGVAGATKGILALAGNTSGLVTIQPAAAAGTWTLTLPVDDGTSGQFLQTNGSGVTSWATASGSGDALVANPLSQFAATSSAQLRGVLSDENGTGVALFNSASGATLISPIIANIAPGANFTLTQNSVVPFTSENAGAVVNTLYLKAGNVGIGTGTPNGLVTLEGASTASDGKTWTAASAAASGGILDSYQDSSGARGFQRYLDIVALQDSDGANGGGVIRLLTNPINSDTAVERVRIDKAGNVGIGTGSPDDKVHVVSGTGTSDTGIGGIRFGTTNTTFTAKAHFGTNFDNFYIVQNAYYNGSAWVADRTDRCTAKIVLNCNASGAGQIDFCTTATNNTPDPPVNMTLYGNGNLGIGTLAGTGSRQVIADSSGVLSASSAAPTSGTYTPTATNVTNITSSTAIISNYIQVGNVVNVSGTITVTATLAIASEVDISLPVASNFAAATDANGTATMDSTASVNLYINADSANDRARIFFTAVGVGQVSTIYFSFQYKVI